MNILQYHGLDLAVHEPETVLDKKEQYRQQAKAGHPKFIRVVRTTGPEETLKERLDRTEMYFKMIAELCDVRIVEHDYGLCPDVNGIATLDHRRLGAGVVPEGFLLVAKVASIAQVAPDLPESIITKIENGTAAFKASVASHAHPYRDVGAHQVVLGHPVEAPAEPDLAWYVDIEPRVGRQALSVPGLDTEAFRTLGIVYE